MMIQTKFQTNEEKFDYVIKCVWDYITATDLIYAAVLKAEIHRSLHVSKGLMMAIAFEILQGKHNELLGIEDRYFKCPCDFPQLNPDWLA